MPAKLLLISFRRRRAGLGEAGARRNRRRFLARHARGAELQVERGQELQLHVGHQKSYRLVQTFQGRRFTQLAPILLHAGAVGQPGQAARRPVFSAAFLDVNVNQFSFGDVYSRPGFSLREGELATIAALTILGTAMPQLEVLIAAGLHPGLSRDEILSASYR